MHGPAEGLARLAQGRRALAHVEVRQHERLAARLAGDAAGLAGGQVDRRGRAAPSPRSAAGRRRAACSPSAGVTAVSPE